MPEDKQMRKKISFFDKYLSVWVILCIAAGVAVGKFLPAIPDTLSKFEYANVSIPVAVLIWLMIYPMMLKVDFTSIVNVTKKPKGLTVTTVTNWLIKPFTMYGIAFLFFKIIFDSFIPAALSTEYLAGAVLLGAAPCTAMVFVWSYLSDGDPAYTLVQVAVNDLIILFAFTPIVAFLLGISEVAVPYKTLFLSVVLFVVIPFSAGYISRVLIIKKKGIRYFEDIFLNILGNPVHIVLIAVPLVIQTFLIFVIAYGWAKAWRIPHSIAAPGAMIGASNFFELAVAVAISLFGLQSGATLVTVVGVLVEVPLMLTLVRIANNTKGWFHQAPVK
jgi:ACR3 family arsenite transporter